MFKRLSIFASPLLLLLLFAACGTPSATPTGSTGSGQTGPVQSDRPTPGGTPVPGNAATPTLPARQKPPRPVPDPADVAAGAPLRATLLAQIEGYGREVAKCNSIGTPVVSCNVTGFEAVRPNSPELAAYMSWYSFIKQCSSDGKGGYIATMMFVYSSPGELREPGLLDVYVSGTPWCGQTRPEATPSATPSARPGTPNATPTVPAGQRPPRPMPDPAAVAAGAPLRATLLAQINAAEKRCAATPTASADKCLIHPGQAGIGEELVAYTSWHSSIAQCHSDGKGGYVFTLALRASTPEQLRDPAMLDVYVANTMWCGLTGSSTVKPSARPSPSATPTLPSGQRVPPPSPDPAAVAAGAPLRATLLAQIDTYEREAGGCGTPSAPDCLHAALQALQSSNPELFAYANWFQAVELCVSDGKGGYGAQARVYVPTAAALRDAARLDLYVANTPWCGYTGSATQVSASGGPGPAISRPSTIPAVQGIIAIATAKSITADGRPTERATEFAVGEEVYITFIALGVGPGDSVDLKLFRDGAAVNLTGTKTTFEKTSTYYGYYRYKPSQTGAYRAELYFNGETRPAHTVTFTVR